jgi:hypothetical protein
MADDHVVQAVAVDVSGRTHRQARPVPRTDAVEDEAVAAVEPIKVEFVPAHRSPSVVTTQADRAVPLSDQRMAREYAKGP